MSDTVDDDDDDDEDPSLTCDHDEAELDILTGRAICWRCGHAWYQTQAEIERAQEAEMAYQRHCDECNAGDDDDQERIPER